MAKVSREQLLQQPFVDNQNYPYGFARSGDFSISESKALSQYGNFIVALMEGELACENEEDMSLLAVANGEQEAVTVAERAWAKYQKRVNRPKAGSIYGNKPTPSKSAAKSREAAMADIDSDDDIDEQVAIEEEE